MKEQDEQFNNCTNCEQLIAGKDYWCEECQQVFCEECITTTTDGVDICKICYQELINDAYAEREDQ